MQYNVKKYVYYSYLGIIHRANRDGFNYFDRSKYKVEYFDEQTNKWVEDDFNLGMEVLNPDSNAIELGCEEYAQYIASEIMESDIKIEEVEGKHLSARRLTDDALENISYAEFKDIIFDALLDYQKDREDIVKLWEKEEKLYKKQYEILKKTDDKTSFIHSIIHNSFMMI